MAFFGLFGGDKPTPQNIQKLTVKLKELYAQPEYRRGAMERLLEFGTPEALDAVLQRFTVVAQSPHWDEEEKRWLVDELAERGALARTALRKFLGRENHIAFAAKALERLTSKDEYTEDLIAALHDRLPEDHRSSQGKSETVACLGTTHDPRVIDAIVPYLDDHADDVQCACIDVLEAQLPQHPNAAADKKLTTILADDARSARVLRHAAGAVFRLKLPIDVTRPLASAILEDFRVADGKLASTNAA